MVIVICYAVHDREVVSVDKFATSDEAWEFLKADATKTYGEEKVNGSDDAELEIDDFDSTAQLTSGNGEYIWTWESWMLD